MAFQIGGALPSLLEALAARSTIFSALLSELSVEGSPTILVFEDVHWADEATLDLIKFLGRRVHRTSTLFLVPYRDAVLARVARLSAAVQQVLEFVSVIPSKTERWLLNDLLPSSSSVLDECLASGMLRLDGEAVAFRHELARRAVEGALTAPRRQGLHGQVLAALSSRDHREVARLVHHADQASDRAAVLRWAPEAHGKQRH